MSKQNSSFLKGRISALLTKHKKEQVIKPALEKETGLIVKVLDEFDTDVFGTFTGDVERPGTQLETARLKAKQCLEISGFDIGLSSEGSFGPHPTIAFIPYNIEIVMLIDKKEDLEIWGEWAGTETNYSQTVVDSIEKAQKFAASTLFPQHHLVVKPSNGHPQELIKGISNLQALTEAVNWAISISPDKMVKIETDMRAHANPTRMANILKATNNLINKINSLCPKCSTPGFWLSERRPGLPCEWCELPTIEILSEIYMCQKCKYTLERMHPKGEKASAGRCQNCNP